MHTRQPTRYLLLSILLLLMQGVASVCMAAVTDAEVRDLLGPPVVIEQLRAHGPDVLPVMARLYTASDEEGKTRIANAFYKLGWPSQQAYEALIEDIRTTNPRLRLEVQWALGRVSGKDEVVDTLLGIMRNDNNALFRDKAACALAYDQIHLSDAQKADLYAGLIGGLDDPTPQVRKISIQALKIHTGQTRGFQATAGSGERSRSVQEWKRWLAEYRDNL
ncbi:MAG: HEAT repeat domain-containing protein [Gammaproteobacteria bacterium]|nr:HEAT repeat domain-containing protein [Gammaproteobacteria bacterium]